MIARLLVIALAALCALVAGCGGDEKSGSAGGGRGDPEAAKVLDAAPAKTRAEGTARVSMSFKGGGRSIFRANGLAALDRDRARLDFTFDIATGGIEAGTEADAVIDGDDVYIRFKRGGMGWIRTPAGAGGASFSTGFADSLNYLSAVTGDAKRLREDEVRGSPVVVYSATVDLEKVAEELPADEREAYREGLEKQGLPKRLPLEVAIDDEGRIARMDYAFELRGTELEISADMYDFGTKGDLSVPEDAREVP